jgi:hypothetical protein
MAVGGGMNTLSVEVAVAPETRVTLDGASDACGPVGETVANREIDPVKPLRLVSVSVELPVDCTTIVRLVGLAVILKSAPWETPVTATLKLPELAEWLESPPYFAVIV